MSKSIFSGHPREITSASQQKINSITELSCHHHLHTWSNLNNKHTLHLQNSNIIIWWGSGRKICRWWKDFVWSSTSNYFSLNLFGVKFGDLKVCWEKFFFVDFNRIPKKYQYEVVVLTDFHAPIIWLSTVSFYREYVFLEFSMWRNGWNVLINEPLHGNWMQFMVNTASDR